MNTRTRLRLLAALALMVGLWSAWLIYRPSEVVSPEASRRARVPARTPAPAAVAARNVAPAAARLGAQAGARTDAQALPVRGTVAVATLRNPFEALPWVAAPRDASRPFVQVTQAPLPTAAEPAAAPLAASPEPPPAPPLQLPYKYLGLHAEHGAAPSVFLMFGERLIVARAGDTITVDGRDYYIADLIPDGGGMTDVILRPI
jgi:hypothetical protein